MQQEKFFKDSRMPFAEVRYTRSSQSHFKPHLHASFSVGAVDKGAVEYSVGKSKAKLEPGALALINPEVLHSCNAPPGKGRSYYMLYLDCSWCHMVQSVLWPAESFVPVETIRLDDMDLYNLYCNTMQSMLNNQIHLQKKEQLLVDLLLPIFRKNCPVVPAPKTVNGNIDHLKELLQNDLDKEFTLESLAEELRINPYTLLRKFKTKTGVTPHAYRMNYRIEKAKKCLQQGMDIVEVALECGFFDQSHLHRHFKAMTTVTPKEYQINFVQ